LIKRKNIPCNIAIDYGLPESIYSYGYNLRLKHSSFKQDTLHWITHHFADLMTVEQPEILSLGCGTGVFELLSREENNGLLLGWILARLI